MSGRDFGRGDRGGFRDRDRGDRGDRGGGFRDRDGGRPGGNFRDRDRGPGGGYGDRGGFRDRGDRGYGGPAGGSRPWEQRDTDRPERPFGSRPFDRPERAEPDQAVRVERYYDDEGGRPPREERGERPQRFGGDRGGDRPGGRGAFGRDAAPAPPRAAPPGAVDAAATPARQRDEAMQQESQPFAASPFVAPRAGESAWTYHHLSDSWRDEERLRGWTPSDDDLREMVEDNIEADPQLNARDRRNIQVRAVNGVVTLTGTVRSRVAKFAAGSDAYWTYGVQEVRNELAVRVRGPQGNAAGETSGAGQTASAPAADAVTGGPEASDAAPAADAAPAKKPKRATRAKAAATLDPPAVTEADSSGIDNEGFMPPRTSPTPRDPGEGLIDTAGGGAEVRASETPVDTDGDDDR